MLVARSPSRSPPSLPASLVASKEVPDPDDPAATVEEATPLRPHAALGPAGRRPRLVRRARGPRRGRRGPHRRHLLRDDLRAAAVGPVVVGRRRSHVRPPSPCSAEPEIDFLTREEKFGRETAGASGAQISLQMMRTSSQVAQYVALRALGYDDASILPGDVVVADLVCLEEGADDVHALRAGRRGARAGRHAAHAPTACRWTPSTTSSPQLAGSQPGDTVELEIDRPGSGRRTVEVELIASPDDPTRTIVGFVPFDTATRRAAVRDRHRHRAHRRPVGRAGVHADADRRAVRRAT